MTTRAAKETQPSTRASSRRGCSNAASSGSAASAAPVRRLVRPVLSLLAVHQHRAPALLKKKLASGPAVRGRVREPSRTAEVGKRRALETNSQGLQQRDSSKRKPRANTSRARRAGGKASAERKPEKGLSPMEGALADGASRIHVRGVEVGLGLRGSAAVAKAIDVRSRTATRASEAWVLVVRTGAQCRAHRARPRRSERMAVKAIRSLVRNRASGSRRQWSTGLRVLVFEKCGLQTSIGRDLGPCVTASNRWQRGPRVTDILVLVDASQGEGRTMGVAGRFELRPSSFRPL